MLTAVVGLKAELDLNEPLESALTVVESDTLMTEELAIKWLIELELVTDGPREPDMSELVTI